MKEYVEKAPHDFAQLREIIGILRRKCPWDSTQTFESLGPCLTDETQEVLDAIGRKDADNLCEELGDVLLQVLLMSEVAEDMDLFTFEDVVQMIAEKMIRRHPFVFGDVELSSWSEGTSLWNEIKRREKENPPRVPMKPSERKAAEDRK